MRTLLNCLIVLVVLTGMSSIAHAGGLSMSLWPTPPVFTGTGYTFRVTVEKADRNDGINQNGPFTLHVYFPEGMTATGSAGGWNCAAPPPGSRELICTINGTLTGNLPGLAGLSVYGKADLAMPLGPTEIRATISSAQVPLPPVLICAPTPSTSGCATAAPEVIESKIEITGWNGDPSPISTWWRVAEAGTEQITSVSMQTTGFHDTPVMLKVKFPPGVTYAGSTSGNLPWVCSPTTEVDGQLLTCATPYLVNGYATSVAFRTNFATDIAVPGPVYFHAAIGNALVPPPTDCVAIPVQRSCGRLAVITRPPSAAYLRFSDPDVQHSQSYFTIGQNNGPVVVNFRNIGDGVAANTAVQIKLPRGFAYTQTYSAIPALNCTASGTLASGQLLTCQGAPMGPGTNGYVSFGVNLDPLLTERPGPVPLVGAIDTSSPASTTLLASCASDPNQINCFWHEIPTYAPCALQYGADGIFCDAFEELDLPTGAGTANDLQR